MTGSVHVALGAAIGRMVKIKLLAFVAGVLSHAAGDMVPHKDLGIIETPLVFGTLAWVGWRHGWDSPQFLGALGGVCPDFEHIPWELRNDPRRFEPMVEKHFPTHNGQLQHGRWPWPTYLGVAMQIALYIGGLYLAGSLGRDES